eukprot:15451817-Alexandrium_andersonii.AAC.1
MPDLGRNSSTNWRVVFKQLQICRVACSGNFGSTYNTSPGVRSLNCAGPGTASNGSQTLPRVDSA